MTPTRKKSKLRYFKAQLCTFGIDFELAVGEKGMTESPHLFDLRDYFQSIFMTLEEPTKPRWLNCTVNFSHSCYKLKFWKIF